MYKNKFTTWNERYSIFKPLLEAEKEATTDLGNASEKTDEDVDEKGLAGKVDPSQTKEDVFKVIPEKVEDENENFNIFAGRDDSGDLHSVNYSTANNDPAMIGLSNVLGGAVLNNKINFEKLVKILFEILGLSTLNADIMKNMSPAIWSELQNYAEKSNNEAFTSFSNFISDNIINQNKKVEIDNLNNK